MLRANTWKFSNGLPHFTTSTKVFYSFHPLHSLTGYIGMSQFAILYPDLQTRLPASSLSNDVWLWLIFSAGNDLKAWLSPSLRSIQNGFSLKKHISILDILFHHPPHITTKQNRSFSNGTLVRYSIPSYFQASTPSLSNSISSVRAVECATTGSTLTELQSFLEVEGGTSCAACSRIQIKAVASPCGTYDVACTLRTISARKVGIWGTNSCNWLHFFCTHPYISWNLKIFAFMLTNSNFSTGNIWKRVEF